MTFGLGGLTAYFTGSVRRQLIWGVALVHAVMMTLFVHDLTLRQQEFLIESQTEEAENLAARHVEADPVERALAALIGLGDALDRDGGFCRGGHGLMR